jgi:hypothetical protein
VCNGTLQFNPCLATLTTTPPSEITANSAKSGGNISNDGGDSVTVRGVAYGTAANPTTANDTVAGGSGTGTYTCNISGLSASTTYYVRAYARNSVGIAYGSQVSFSTTTCGGIPPPPADCVPQVVTGGANVIATIPVLSAGYNVGDTIVVPIGISMATGISTAAISLAIDYDTTKLRCISAVTNLNPAIAVGFISNCGSFTNQNPNPPFTAASRRQFRVAWFNLVPVVMNGTLFNIRFVVMARGNTQIRWDTATPGNNEFADEIADVIPGVQWCNGGVNNP